MKTNSRTLHTWVDLRFWQPAIITLVGLLPALASAEQIKAAPDPLPLIHRHSADWEGDAMTIDASEATLTLNLWRGGQYGMDDTTDDGYAVTGTDTNGIPHAADFTEPFWQIGYAEMLRFMALHRASQYRYDANAPDNFAPVADAIAYTAPLPGSTTGTTRYVSVLSTNATAPYTTPDTAANTIQDALHISNGGDLVLVDQGIYNSGSVSNGYGLSRIAITSGVTVASLHGPELTIIEGSLTNFIRGVFMHHARASLLGFTIRNSASHGISGNLNARNGGGIFILGATNVANCIIHNNTASPWGIGGGVYMNSVSMLFEKSQIYSNTAYVGGGVYIQSGGNTVVNRCLIRNNTAQWDGGGIFFDNGRKVYNLIVYANHSQGRGGGVSIANNAELWNSIVVDNTSANPGSGIHYSGSGSSVRNTIIHENQGTQIFAATNANSIRYSVIPYDPDLAITTVSNVNETPLFVNYEARNFRPVPGSSSIDRGETDPWMAWGRDMDGLTRTNGTRPDAGAYEFYQPSVTSQPSAYIPGNEVEIIVGMTFPTGQRLLTFGIELFPETDWEVINVTGNVTMEADPHSNGFIATGDLTQEVALVVTLLAPANATGAVPFAATMAWMTSGQEELSYSSIVPDPYTILPLYPVTVLAEEGGSVTSTGGWYAAESVIQFTALPDPGWRFDRWLGDTNGSTVVGESIYVTVADAASIYASFIRVYSLNIASIFSSTAPSMGLHVYDTGSLVDVSVLDAAVQVGQTGYVNVGWSGTGSVPASGSERAMSFTITTNSTITWEWVTFSAQHATRGYRAAGRMSSIVACDVWYEPAATITQVWWRPVIPTTWSVHRVWGDANPIWNDGLVLLSGEDLTSGHLRFYYDATLPDDTQGMQEVGGEAGVNTPQ